MWLLAGSSILVGALVAGYGVPCQGDGQLPGTALSEALRPGGTKVESVTGRGIHASMVVRRLQQGRPVDLTAELSDDELTWILVRNSELFPPMVAGEVTVGIGSAYNPAKTAIAVNWLARHGAGLREKETAVTFAKTLPLTVRMFIAEYLAAQLDERCVPLYEASYLEWAQDHVDKVTGEIVKSNGSVPGVHPLAWYYQAKEQWELAADTYMLSEKFSTSAVWVSDALMESGRAYKLAGNEVKSQAAYARLAVYAKGWFLVLAAYDRAYPLLQDGKIEEGRAEIVNAFGLVPPDRDGLVAQNSILASIAFGVSDAAAACEYARKALVAGANHELPSKELRHLYTMAEDIYQRTGGWKQTKLVVRETRISLASKGMEASGPRYGRTRVLTYGDPSVTATVDNPLFNVRILPIDNWTAHASVEPEVELIVEVPAENVAAVKGKRATVTVLSSIRGTSLGTATVTVDVP